MLNLAFLLVLRHMYGMGNYNTYVGMFKAVRLCVKAQRLRKLQKEGSKGGGKGGSKGESKGGGKGARKPILIIR